LRIFQLILSSNLFPISFGASNKCYYRNSSCIIVYTEPTKNIAYHITEELIFYADKITVISNLKNLRVFNFAILLKSRKLQKFYAREIYMFYSSVSAYEKRNLTAYIIDLRRRAFGVLHCELIIR